MTRNPMYPIVLSLEVQNSFEYPSQAQLLSEEIRDMAARIEDTTDFSEADVFLSAALETGIEVTEVNLDVYARWVAELSREFPGLILALDAAELEDRSSDVDQETLWRWYFRDGRRQIAKPYLVIPDFDPDEAGEEIL